MNRTRAPADRAASSRLNVPTTSLSNVVAGSSIESWTEIDAARWAIASTSRVQRRQASGSRTSPISNGRRSGWSVERREVHAVAGHQVVDRQDRVTSLEELGDDPATDEPGRTRDEDLHALRTPLAGVRASASATSWWTSSGDIGGTASDRYAPTGAEGASR